MPAKTMLAVQAASSGGQQVGLREGDRHRVHHPVAHRDHDGHPDAHGAPAAARRDQREGNRHQRHDHVHEREGELGVELDEVAVDLVAALAQLRHVGAQLEEAHGVGGVLHLDEVVDVLRHRHEPRGERLRGDPVLRADPPEHAVAELPALGGPLRVAGVEPLHQPEVGADLEHGEPFDRLPTGSSSSMRKKRVSEERYQIWVWRWRWRGSWPRIFTRSTSSALALMSGSTVSWKTTASDADGAGHQEDGQARPVEADAGRLERVELALAGEGEEEEHGGDQHDHRQPLVELAGQPVEEVLEDVSEGRLDPQEAVEGLQQVHHHDEHRADRRCRCRGRSGTARTR